MSNDSHRQPENSLTDVMSQNQLWDYLQSMDSQTVSQLSKPTSPEVLQLIQRSIVATLGNLPGGKFNTTITTSRDELGKLLGSAMVDGYFLRNVEQRLELEKACLPPSVDK
ncbi:DUF760 domain-containing protein [Nostoc sp. CMAA1605]|uniref:DUF760 domain-containing protein n=1 Tax=Nostoc sp. CMAA1605 TaxID=2055159 RepID=UPI001F2EFBC4|nr:DUF760 domain-containing protein [Nostoc sp. CMAA1605]MCF4970790.1 hypothetical protein [Nostoc sp. CMAA1605]